MAIPKLIGIKVNDHMVLFHFIFYKCNFFKTLNTYLNIIIENIQNLSLINYKKLLTYMSIG